MAKVDNSKNLKPRRLSKEQALELARLSTEARRKKALERKSAKEFAEMALNAEIEDKKTGEKIITKDAIIKKVIAKALQDGDLNCVKYLMELVGDSPAQRVDVTTNGKDVGNQIVFSPTPLSEKDIQEIKAIQNGTKDSDNTGISET